jgi:hypothetical protein
VDAFSSFFVHDLTSQVAAFSADYLRGMGLQPAALNSASTLDLGLSG